MGSTATPDPTFRRSQIFLGLALLWSVVVFAVIFGYHIAEPISSMGSISTNGHTYFGNPPALTLFQRDSVSFINVVIVLVAGLVVSMIDLVVRIVRHSQRPGTVAVIAGVVVVLFSLFGLLWGVASVGVVGVLLILSGRPTRHKNVK